MIDTALKILEEIPVELVDEISSYIFDERGYSRERYEQFQRENRLANKRILNELKMLYRTYFWQRFELFLNTQEIETIEPVIRLSYIRGKEGFYNLYNLNYILRLEVENVHRNSNFSAEQYWINRRKQYSNMDEKQRQMEMEQSVFRYIDNTN